MIALVILLSISLGVAVGWGITGHRRARQLAQVIRHIPGSWGAIGVFRHRTATGDAMVCEEVSNGWAAMHGDDDRPPEALIGRSHYTSFNVAAGYRPVHDDAADGRPAVNVMDTAAHAGLPMSWACYSPPGSGLVVIGLARQFLPAWQLTTGESAEA